MGAERQHRPDDRELARLLDELDHAELELVMPGKQTLAERRDQRTPMPHLPRAASKSQGRTEPRPGQFALVGDIVASMPKLKFDDCRALALRDVLSRLRQHPRLREETLAAADPQVAHRLRPRHRENDRLNQASFAEAEAPRRFATGHSIRSGDDGIRDGSPQSIGQNQQTPQGLAMWGAVNQRAVTLYRRATATGIGAPETRQVADAIGAIGKGAPLPLDVRLKLEAALGVSLENVRLHIGQVARDAAQAVCAEAFTVGEDIFFPAYDPTSQRCQETLAHEVVHTVQWRQGRIGVTAGGTAVSRPDDPLEREAEREAKSIVARVFHSPRAHHRPVEPAHAATNGGADTLRARPPTVDRQSAPVATAVSPVAPSTPGVGLTVMRRQAIENQRPNDVPIEVSSWTPFQRLDDLKKSITEAPSYIMEVGGEYASLLAENWGWIGLGILAGFGIERALESTQPWLAISGFVLAQLAQGTGLAVIATSIKSHAVNWATLGWNACGDGGMIREASKELVRLVGSVLSLASLAFRVFARIVLRWIKTFFDSTLKGSAVLQTALATNGYVYAGQVAVESTSGLPPARAMKQPARRSPNLPLSMAMMSEPEWEPPGGGGGGLSEQDLAKLEHNAGLRIDTTNTREDEGVLTLYPSKAARGFSPENRIGSLFYRIHINKGHKEIQILSLYIDDNFLDPKGNPKQQRNQLCILILNRLLYMHPNSTISQGSNGSVNSGGNGNGRNAGGGAPANGGHQNEPPAQSHKAYGNGDAAKSTYTTDPKEQKIRQFLAKADEAAKINKLAEVAADAGLSVEQSHQLAAEHEMTLGGVRLSYWARDELERAYALERWNSSALEGGQIEVASNNGTLETHDDKLPQGESAHRSGGDNGHSRSGHQPPTPPRVRPENSFAPDDRHRIARRAMAAEEFGQLTQIAIQEETSPAAVYHFCQELDFTTVRQPPDPAMKREVVARLKAAKDAGKEVFNATIHAIVVEKRLPIEILKLWLSGRYSDEERLAYLGKTLRRSADLVAKEHGFALRSLPDWKDEFGWQHPIRTWKDEFEWPQYAPRTQESFALEERRQMALEAHQAPEFGGLTKVALRHRATPAMVFQCEREFGLKTTRQPVNPQAKKKAIAEVRQGADPANVADELRLPIELIREWTHGRYTGLADEERLTIALESAHSVDEDVSLKYKIGSNTPAEWRNEFGIEKLSKRQGVATELSIETAREVVAEVSAAPQFGELTRIAYARGMKPVEVYHCAERVGIQLVRFPFDPTMKQRVVDIFRGSRGVDAMKDPTGYAMVVESLSQELNLPIDIVRSWAQDDSSDEEALAAVAETAYLSVRDVLKRHGITERKLNEWMTKRFRWRPQASQ